MKIKETRAIEGGFAGHRVQTRVIEFPEGEEFPENAEKVDDKTEVYDWKDEVIE